MSNPSLPELISFKVCPFVQRSAIALTEKKVAFKTTYVDLEKLPEWFLEISPLRKVPVLRIDKSVIFESAVIAEYLDEAFPPKLHPDNLLEKASHRSWTEFASDMTSNMYGMLYAKSEEEFDSIRKKIAQQFSQVEKIIDPKGPYFSGNKFSLVDAAFAPLLLRLQLVENDFQLHLFDKDGPIAHWSKELLNRSSVKNSVVDDFEALFLFYNKNSGGYLGEKIIQAHLNS